MNDMRLVESYDILVGEDYTDNSFSDMIRRHAKTLGFAFPELNQDMQADILGKIEPCVCGHIKHHEQPCPYCNSSISAKELASPITIGDFFYVAYADEWGIRLDKTEVVSIKASESKEGEWVYFFDHPDLKFACSHRLPDAGAGWYVGPTPEIAISHLKNTALSKTLLPPVIKTLFSVIK